MIVLRAHTRQAVRFLGNLRQYFTEDKIDGVVLRVAYQVQRNVVLATPKGWTGLTRRSWSVRKRLGNGYSVTNSSKVMAYLERGTRAHGPVRAQALYIPLKSGAMIWRSGLVFGRDYILVKRVRGIRARHIAAKEARKARGLLTKAVNTYVRSAVQAS